MQYIASEFIYVRSSACHIRNGKGSYREIEWINNFGLLISIIFYKIQNLFNLNRLQIFVFKFVNGYAMVNGIRTYFTPLHYESS